MKILAADVDHPGERGDEGISAGVVLDDRLTIACGDGAIRRRWSSWAGRGVQAVPELLRGFPIPAGTRL